MTTTGLVRSKHTRWVIRATLLYILIAIVIAITILPFLWMISTSFKVPTEAIKVPPEWIPRPAIIDNYVSLFTSDILPFPNFILNSIKVAVLVVVGRLFICSLAGYGFARLSFPGRDGALAFLIGSMMIPGMVTIFPLYFMYARMQWLDTHWPLIVPQIVANTFGTFLMRQFLMTIPKDLEDAAIIDGSSHFGVFWNIMLPLSKPVLATLGIFTFMSSWNNFFAPLIFLNRTQKFTLPLGLAFFNNSFSTQYTKLMAGVVLSLIPILIVYTFAQKYFTRGIALTGLKG
jgi:multiple sugar transport system permease protein